MKVLIRSNEDEPTLIGEFLGFHTYPNGSSIPVVRVDGVDLFCMAAVVPYSAELLKKLQSMPNKEAFWWLAKETQEGRVKKIKAPK